VKPLAMEEIRKAVSGHWLAVGPPTIINAVSTDTRTAKAGDLFFAIRGEKLDGHMFLHQAADAGCAGAVVCLDGEPRPEVGRRFPAGLIGVADSTRALGALAGYHRGLLPATVVGVTGSNGKTTVKRMIDHILSTQLAGTCSPKSFNNNIGVPLTLLAAQSGDAYVICEIGSSAPGEIESLAAMARPSVVAITNASETHLKKLGSLEKVAAEKASILGRLADDGLAVVFADSKLLMKLAKAYESRIITYGQSEQADLRLTSYECQGQGQVFGLNDRLKVELRVPGRHNALNALAAVAIAQRFGFSQAEAAKALSSFEGVPMRLEWIKCGQVTVINDAYNANPASMLAAADVLQEANARRRILIAGDMGELGRAAQDIHLHTGRKIAGKHIDLLIGVGPLGRYIAQGASELCLAVQSFDTVREAQHAITGLLQPGDLVLVKASRVMAMERLVETIRGNRAFGGKDDAAKSRRKN